MRTLGCLLLIAGALSPQSGPEWEKDFDAARAKAAKEGKALVAVVGSDIMKVGRLSFAMTTKVEEVRHLVAVRVNIDTGFPPVIAKLIQGNQGFAGGVVVLAPRNDDGVYLGEMEVSKLKADEFRSWILDAVDRYVPICEATPAVAEWRAQLQDKPLLVLSGYDSANTFVFRDALLDEIVKGCVVVRPSSDLKRLPVKDSPGGALLDSNDLSELATWKWPKDAKHLREILAKPVNEWNAKAAERRRLREREFPFVCGFCGFRGRDPETCCGDTMAKPAAVTWEKSFDEAKARALKEKRVLVYGIYKDKPTIYDEMLIDPRLSVLLQRAVFFAEAKADSGTRTGDFNVSTGVVILAPRTKTEISVQSRLEGQVLLEPLRREVAAGIRRLRMVK